MQVEDRAELAKKIKEKGGSVSEAGGSGIDFQVTIQSPPHRHPPRGQLDCTCHQRALAWRRLYPPPARPALHPRHLDLTLGHRQSSTLITSDPARAPLSPQVKPLNAPPTVAGGFGAKPQGRTFRNVKGSVVVSDYWLRKCLVKQQLLPVKGMPACQVTLHFQCTAQPMKAYT